VDPVWSSSVRSNFFSYFGYLTHYSSDLWTITFALIFHHTVPSPSRVSSLPPQSAGLFLHFSFPSFFFLGGQSPEHFQVLDTLLNGLPMNHLAICSPPPPKSFFWCSVRLSRDKRCAFVGLKAAVRSLAIFVISSLSFQISSPFLPMFPFLTVSPLLLNPIETTSALRSTKYHIPFFSFFFLQQLPTPKIFIPSLLNNIVLTSHAGPPFVLCAVHGYPP